MKKSLLVIALGLAAGGAMAQQETGRVLSSVPVIQQVAVPRQVCTQAQVVQRPSSGGGAIIGAVVGGLLGNTIGHGGGRAAATGVGVIAGAAVGDSVEGRGAAQAVQQCSTQTYYENRTVGYNVTYEYNGRQYQVQMPYDPGPSVPLQVTPVGSAPMAPPPGVQPIVTGPVSSAVPTIIESPVTVMAAPSAVVPVVYPAYYSQPYYPAGVSLSFGYYGGWGGHHHHRGHWR